MHSLVSRAMVALGELCLLVAAFAPWMELPSGFATQSNGQVTCTTSEPYTAIPFRASCLVMAVAMGVGHLRHRRTSDRKAMLATSALAVQLFFPCVVMTWDTSFSARANWLQIQHENLTWSGGDLPSNLEYSRKSWKDKVYLVDTPRQINVVRMPSSGLGAFQSGRLEVWFETLGYSNCFCQFVRRGWFAALVGMSLLIMGECLPGGRLSRRRVSLAALAGVVMALACLIAVTTPVVIASRRLERARRATALGLYDKAESYLQGAIRVLPSLREDTFYVAQVGLLDYRRGQDKTPEGRLLLASLLERQGRYAQATAMYAALIAEMPEASAIRREANRAILREGASALNAGRHEDAIRRLESVLHEEPCNLKANYALQLAYLRTGRRADVERLVRQIEAIYKHLQMPTKAIVLAQSHENEMFAALKEQDMDATFRQTLEAKKQ